MISSDPENQMRAAAIAVVMGEICRGVDAQGREDAAQLLAHLYKNGHRTAGAVEGSAESKASSSSLWVKLTRGHR